MSSKEPILIPDDQEEYQQFKSDYIKMQRAHELQRAHMVSKLQVMFTVEKFNLSIDKKEAQQKLKADIKDYFKDIIDISQENFYPRRDADNTDEIINDSIILFGVDFLSNKNIRPMIGDSKQKITWLDSSHCKITFQCAENVQKMMEQCSAIDEQISPYEWREFKKYEILTFPRTIYCRYATKSDCFDGDRKSPKYNQFKNKQGQYKEQLAEKNKDDYLRYIKDLGIPKLNVCGPQINRNLRDLQKNKHNRFDTNRNWRGNRNDRSDQYDRNRRYKDDKRYQTRNFQRNSFRRNDDYRQRSRNKYYRNQNQDENKNRGRRRSPSSNSRSQSVDDYDDKVFYPQQADQQQNQQNNLNLSLRNDESFQNQLQLRNNMKLDIQSEQDEVEDKKYHNKEDLNSLNISLESNKSQFSYKLQKNSSHNSNRQKKTNKSGIRNTRDSYKNTSSSQLYKPKERTETKNNYKAKPTTSKNDGNWKFQGGKERVQEKKKSPEQSRKQPEFDY